jgi:hypothetical protein
MIIKSLFWQILQREIAARKLLTIIKVEKDRVVVKVERA